MQQLKKGTRILKCLPRALCKWRNRQKPWVWARSTLKQKAFQPAGKKEFLFLRMLWATVCVWVCMCVCLCVPVHAQAPLPDTHIQYMGAQRQGSLSSSTLLPFIRQRLSPHSQPTDLARKASPCTSEIHYFPSAVGVMGKGCCAQLFTGVLGLTQQALRSQSSVIWHCFHVKKVSGENKSCELL